MNTAMIILQILMNLPYKPPMPRPPSGVGTGTLLIAACTPGENVVVEPGDHLGTADKDGVAEIQVQAQSADDDPYLFVARGKSTTFNGTVLAHNSLSAVCP